jgi:outer membrane lipoprotein carrier protein
MASRRSRGAGFAAALALCLAWAPARAGAQTKADSVLDRAVQRHGALRTLRASFVQTITNPLTGSNVTARGELQQQPPRYLSVVFTQPRGDRIVADGQSLWVQLPSALPDQVMRLPLGAGGPGLGGVDLLGQFFENPRAKYAVTAVGPARVDGRAMFALVLTPKDGEGLFAKATIWLDDATGYLRQFETTDANGVVRRVRIVKFAPNGRIDDGVFRFVPPKGAKIIERPGF